MRTFRCKTEQDWFDEKFIQGLIYLNNKVKIRKGGFRIKASGGLWKKLVGIVAPNLVSKEIHLNRHINVTAMKRGTA